MKRRLNLTLEQVYLMHQASQNKVKNVEISARFGVSQSSVSRILHDQSLIRQAIKYAKESGKFTLPAASAVTSQVVPGLSSLGSAVPLAQREHGI